MKNLFKTKSTLIFIYLLLITLVLEACSAAQMHLKNGNYQAAIEVGAKRMRRNPKNADKTILAIERAFKIEKSRIIDKVNQLKIDGSPENWLAIYNQYKQLDQYQKALKPVLPMFLKKEFRNADIQLIDIDQDLADTKLKAAEYLYVEAERLLNSNVKTNAREAYGRFKKVKELQSNFRDVDSKINESFDKGQNHILVGYTNSTQLIIPQSFMSNLRNYDPKTLNSTWTKYHLNNNARSSYDYAIEVRIGNVDIGPEQIRESSYEDVKKVQDGYQYVLDGKGNVAKDTLGNDLKEPRYIDAKAFIVKTEQTKVGILSGEVIYKNANKKTFNKKPFREDLVFKNFFGVFKGDKRAISKQSAELLGGRFIPFPPDLQMVMDASQLIKQSTFDIIKGNEKLVYE